MIIAPLTPKVFPNFAIIIFEFNVMTCVPRFYFNK